MVRACVLMGRMHVHVLCILNGFCLRLQLRLMEFGDEMFVVSVIVGRLVCHILQYAVVVVLYASANAVTAKQRSQVRRGVTDLLNLLDASCVVV